MFEHTKTHFYTRNYVLELSSERENSFFFISVAHTHTHHISYFYDSFANERRFLAIVSSSLVINY